MCMQAKGSYMCLGTAGYGWVGQLSWLVEPTHSHQPCDLGRPVKQLLGTSGSRWVGQLSWVGLVGFYLRTSLRLSTVAAMFVYGRA